MAGDDLARLGIAIDSSSALDAKEALDQLPASAQRAQQAVNSLGDVSDRNAKRMADYARQMQMVNSAVNVNQRVVQSSLTGLDTSTQSANIAAYGKSLDDVRAKYNPLFAAGRDYKATLEGITQAVAVGAITQTEAAKAIDVTKEAFASQVKLLRGEVTPEFNRMTAQSMAAFHAARSMAEGIAMGIPPSQMMAQQIAHLSFAASGPGGLVQAFKGAASFATGLITPTVAVVGGLGALGVTAVVAQAAWSSAQGTIIAGLQGIGSVSGATVKDINGIAASIALTGQMSFGQAREAATEIAKIGTIGVENIKPLADTTRNLSIVLGTDFTKAAKAGADAVGELALGSTQGLIKLNAQVNFLDGSMLDQIETMLKLGKTADAQRIAIAGIAGATSGATEALTFWGRTGQAVTNTLSAVWNSAGAGLTALTGVGQTLQEKYDDAVTSLKTAQSLAKSGIDVPQSTLDNLQKQVDLINAAVMAQQRLQKERGNQFQGLLAQQTAQGAMPEVPQLSELQKQFSRLQNAFNNPAILKNAGDVGVLTQAYDRLSVAIANRVNANGSALTMEQHETAVFQASIALIQARTAAERQDAAAAAARAQVQFTNTDPNVAADRARAAVQTQITAAFKDQIAALQDEEQIAGAVTNAAKAHAQAEAAVNQALREGKTAMQAQEIGEQMLANSRAAANASVSQQIIGLNQQTELIYARLNGDEASVAAAQAYTNAMNAGASATEAAALQAATLANYLARADAAAGALGSISIGGIIPASVIAGGGGGQVISSTPQSVASSGSSFTQWVGYQNPASDTAKADYLNRTYGPGNWQVVPFATASQSGSQNYVSVFVDPSGVEQFHQQQQQQAAQAAQQAAQEAAAAAAAQQQAAQQAQQQAEANFQQTVAGSLVGGGDAQSLISQIQSGAIGAGVGPNVRFDELLDLYKRAGITPQQTISDIKSGVIGQGADQTKLLQAIDQLNQSITSLNNSVLGLSDIYTQGHGPIGYYHAASGMTGLVGGAGGVDQTPVHMMLSRGELLSVIPADIAQTMLKGGGSGKGLPAIIQNIMLPSIQGVGARRSARQLADAARRAMMAGIG